MKKLIVFFISLANTLTTFIDGVEIETDTFLEAGYRKDNLRWSVSSQPDANIVIKEKWKDLEIFQIAGEVDVYLYDRFYVSCKADYGKLTNGKKSYDEIDLDEIVSFDEDGWLNAHTKGHVYDFSCASGYIFPFFCNRLLTIPLIGYSYHFQRFIDSDYTDAVFLLNLFDEVRSFYSYRWRGPWAGLYCSYLFENSCKIAFEYQYHWLSYHGNIKDNFVEHDGEIQKNHHAHAHNISIKLISPSWNNFALGLVGNYHFAWGKNGTNTTDNNNFDLKKLSWNSSSVLLTLLKSF